MTPTEAYFLALKQGPANETRKAACQNSSVAFFYARDVDCCGREDTRAAACRGPFAAYRYAYYVDKCLHPEAVQALPSVWLAGAREQFEFD